MMSRAIKNPQGLLEDDKDDLSGNFRDRVSVWPKAERNPDHNAFY